MCDEYKMTEICELKDRLISCAQAEFAKGLDNVSTKEAGEVIDMIKDLAQTEKYCREANYYRLVSETMENSRYGYSPNRKLKGKYRPYMDEGFEHEEERYPRFREEDQRYGRAYNDWKESRRYYTQTNSPRYREDMDAHAAEHIGDTLATIREIWKNADPELRKRMKSDFTTLVNEMNV